MIINVPAIGNKKKITGNNMAAARDYVAETTAETLASQNSRC